MTDAAKRIADQALEYVFDPPVASDRVIDYASPNELIAEFATTVGLGIDVDQQPVSPDQLVDAVQTIIDRSMHTTHPRFFNQNFAGPEPIAVVGDWLAAALNTTNATFEVAPVFTMMERAVINKMAGSRRLPRRPCAGSAPARHPLSWRLVRHAARAATGTAPSLSRHSPDRCDWRTARRLRVPGRALRHAQVSRADGPGPAVRDRSRYRCNRRHDPGRAR